MPASACEFYRRSATVNATDKSILVVIPEPEAAVANSYFTENHRRNNAPGVISNSRCDKQDKEQQERCPSAPTRELRAVSTSSDVGDRETERAKRGERDDRNARQPIGDRADDGRTFSKDLPHDDNDDRDRSQQRNSLQSSSAAFGVETTCSREYEHRRCDDEYPNKTDTAEYPIENTPAMESRRTESAPSPSDDRWGEKRCKERCCPNSCFTIEAHPFTNVSNSRLLKLSHTNAFELFRMYVFANVVIE